MPPFARDWSLFLDVDGTLLDYAAEPDAVRVDVDLRRLVGHLSDATGGAVAFISGRSIDDMDRLFAPLVMPMAGLHGTERRSADGTLHGHAPALDGLGEAARDLVRLTSAHSALVLENKGMALALHYRKAPGLEPLVLREMHRVADRLGDEFELQAGKFVYEIKPSGKDKGSAVREFLDEPPFTGHTPVFVGDDLTDEFAFDVVNRAGGHAVKVGAGESRARWRLANAAAVRRWLVDYVRFCSDAHTRRGVR